MIQNDLYFCFAEPFETLNLAILHQMLDCVGCSYSITDQILYAPTGVMLRGPVDQIFYDPIPELREQ
jgi:hypothetical protein